MNPINKKTTLQFPDEFFNEEIRCDFLVTEKRKKVWAVEIDLLNELLKVCKKYNIKVVVYAGTLLGAVRHKGIIPWDDDIDVALSRPEYEKLCCVAHEEFKGPYFFQNYYTDPQYLFGYSRLRNSLTTGRILGQDNKDYNNGIYIDIFVLDGYINDDILLRKQLHSIRNILRLDNAYNKNYSPKPLKRRVQRVFYSMLSPILHTFFYREKLADEYMKLIQQYNDEAKRVSLMTHTYSFVSKYWCDLSDLRNIMYVPFENIMVPIPCNYDNILRNMYGEYMSFPPFEARGKWHDGIIQFNPDVPYTECR